MKTAEEIKSELLNYYGTEAYHKWSPLFANFVLTDGALFVCEECGAFWLADMIASHLSKYKDEGFAVASLQRVKESDAFKFLITDGNDRALVRQDIEFSDFPLDTVVLYVAPQDSLWVVLLPSEW